MISHQIKLETKYSNNQQIPKLSDVVERSGILEEYDEDYSKWLKTFLVHMIIHKQMDISTAVGITKNTVDTLQQAADNIVIAINNDLVTWNEATQKLITMFNLDEETQLEMSMYMFPPPMLTRPKLVTNNKQTGYLLEANQKSVILGRNHYNKDVCLDVINILNSMELSFDTHVLDKAENTFKNIKNRKPGETYLSYQKRIKQFKKFNSDSRMLIDDMLDTSNKFHLTHAVDKRGRLYCRGYHVNYQGHEWAKAIISFHNKELVRSE